MDCFAVTSYDVLAVGEDSVSASAAEPDHVQTCVPHEDRVIAVASEDYVCAGWIVVDCGGPAKT